MKKAWKCHSGIAVTINLLCAGLWLQTLRAGSRSRVSWSASGSTISKDSK
jgi:hypothetical protein